MLRAILLFAAALGCFSLVALAQPGTPPEKKSEAVKGKDDGKTKAKEPGKPKDPEEMSETPKDPPKAKIPLDRLKLPKDAIIIILDDPLEALPMLGKLWVAGFDEYIEMKERIKALERQLKPDKKIPFSCDLTGHLAGDFVEFDAEFHFSTEAPNTSVLIGLQGGYLRGGDLDGQMPIFDHNKDDGWVVKVAKEANRHRLLVSFRVPVQVKKTSSGTIERGIELGLPGAVLTTLNLKLHDNVKELRCNEVPEKIKKEGRWQPPLVERSKSLSLAWKEPTANTGNAPLRKADALIKVDVEATHVNITAELSLEDTRPQTKEWRLILPKQAKIVEVKAPFGVMPEWNKSDDKPYHVLSLSEATSDRVQVSISMRVPRPKLGQSVAIGPFHVHGAFEQRGTISVKMPAEASSGQRLHYTRADGTYEILQIKNTETEASFSYVFSDKNPKAPPAPKAPLELEWRFEKNQLDTQVAHELKLQIGSLGWELEVATSIKVKAPFSAINTVELRLPQPRPRGLGLIGTATPGLDFPGALPWVGALEDPWAQPEPDEFTVQDELGLSLKLTPQDSAGKTRVFIERRPPAKEVTLKLKARIRLPADSRRFRVELPRPFGTQDRGAKLSIQADERIELLHGPQGAEEPLPNRHRFVQILDQAPNHADLVWKPYQREVVAQSTIDITLHDRTAQVKQTLQFPRVPATVGLDPANPQIALKVPPDLKVTPPPGCEIIVRDSDREIQWLRLGKDHGDKEIVLQYDLALLESRTLEVTPIWPVIVSQKDVKVRVWTSPGVKARLSEEPAFRGVWKERSIEIVREKEQFPSLVLHGYGSSLPLTLQIEDATASTLAAFLADRALIQVRMLDDGSQQVKARYLIRKIHAAYVDIELPVPLSRFDDRPSFSIGKKTQWEAFGKSEKMVRVQLHPDQVKLPAVLEIDYTVPRDGMDRNSFWRTTLHAPVFHSEVVIAQTRWQLTTATPVVAAALGRNVAAETQWNLHWLPMPESSVTSADWDVWLLDKESAQEPAAVTYSFTHSATQQETVYHLPRNGWLLACSGVFLIVALGGYYSPLSRAAFWLMLLSLALAVLSLSVFAPAFLPPVLFGLQPGLTIFLVFVAAHWLLQERHRRQVSSSNGFSRTKPSSTIVRTQAAKRPREASTVDAPIAAASAEESAAKSDSTPP